MCTQYNHHCRGQAGNGRCRLLGKDDSCFVHLHELLFISGYRTSSTWPMRIQLPQDPRPSRSHFLAYYSVHLFLYNSLSNILLIYSKMCYNFIFFPLTFEEVFFHVTLSSYPLRSIFLLPLKKYVFLTPLKKYFPFTLEEVCLLAGG